MSADDRARHADIPSGERDVGLRAHTDELIRANRDLQDSLAELRHIEERLRAESRTLARAQRIANVGSYEWDLRSGVVTWSDQAFRIHGFEPGTIAPTLELALERIHPEDREYVRTRTERSVLEGRGQSAEYRILRADGERIVWAESEVLVDEDGQPTRMFGVIQDVTELRRAEASARQAAEHLRLAVGAARIGVWTYDPRSGRIASSLGMHELVGLPSAQEGDGAAIAARIHPEDVAQVRERIARLPHGGRVETEYRIVRSDGQVRWLMTRAESSLGASGRTWLHGVSWDVTERKDAEEERRQLLAREQLAREQAESANRQKDEFLATLSHELRTPLNSILGWIDLLRTGELDVAETAEALDTIERNAQRQRQLIADILDVSKIIQGKVQLDRRPSEPWEFIEPAMKSMQPIAREKGVRLRSSLDETGPILVDVGRMQQVVSNLVSNALKFSRQGGTVEVEVVDEGAWITLRVRDDGEGISPEFLPHVFERFRQADSTTSRRHGGLGLGLAIVRHLVELHGGAATAQSAGLGSGSLFSVRLPKSESGEAGEEQRRSTEAAEEERLRSIARAVAGVRVLVVDDEEDARLLVAAGLGRFGAVVDVAASAREALERIAACRPDVLVSDVGMPGDDGYALIREVRALPPESGGRIPALALTAYAGAEDRRKLLAAGFQLHVTKPISSVELASKVVQLVRPALLV
jgi:PAS domain S-box-containing protein